ncbi:TPA: hypothetical protein N0F65_012846 [Lagenidium giganteum]|uniref:N-acetyltransferase n=1 Tax=Lagenidium giganteum TaxID=4803 RepID=A0AAV2YNY9_9STRA|nr:TPA: hypothetical protein N0F65_012846 [Lagenidium giganteum]
MLDVNDVLMRRTKVPMKRKREIKGASFTSVKQTPVKFASRSLEQSTLPVASKAKTDNAAWKTPSPSPTASPAQSYIDVGQKDFGRSINCPKCGLLYTVGEEEDESEHKKFCRRFSRGVTLIRWKNERLIKVFPDQKARIIEVRRNDPLPHVKKLLEVKALLDDALGFVTEELFLRRSCFLFVEDRQVIACVTAERIDHAYKIDEEATNLVIRSTDTETSSAQASTVKMNDTVSHPAVLGVCQLWVHAGSRGKRVASRLIDAVRDKFIYGHRIAKDQVAFAQPTRDGLRFAAAYVAPHEVLMYDALALAKQLS